MKTLKWQEKNFTNLLQWNICSPGDAVKTLNVDSLVFKAGATSALWNNLSPSWVRNVILMLTASAAPQPVSLKICWAWTKFSAASNARVRKNLAVNHISQLYNLLLCKLFIIYILNSTDINHLV